MHFDTPPFLLHPSFYIYGVASPALFQHHISFKFSVISFKF